MRLVPLIALLLATSANAQTKLPGFFIAQEVCPATPSTRNPDNPGDIETAAMRAYEMIGINKPGGAFYQIRVPGVPAPTARWVPGDCGVHVVKADGGPGDTPDDDGDLTEPLAEVRGEDGPEWTDNLLTLSWQAAFCESSAGQRKDECEALNDGDMPQALTRLSIHGLWPQPRARAYCGDDAQAVKADDKPDPGTGRYDALPAVVMDDDTRTRLAEAMPGTASGLEKHEWVKHGTCYRGPGGSDEYYDDTLFLADEINRSGLADFLSGRIGRIVTVGEIRAEFDRAYGAGAGARVEVRCSRDGSRDLIGEVWIPLVGTISEASDIGELILAANPRGTTCGSGGGIVDPAGLQ